MATKRNSWNVKAVIFFPTPSEELRWGWKVVAKNGNWAKWRIKRTLSATTSFPIRPYPVSIHCCQLAICCLTWPLARSVLCHRWVSTVSVTLHHPCRTLRLDCDGLVIVFVQWYSTYNTLQIAVFRSISWLQICFVYKLLLKSGTGFSL